MLLCLLLCALLGMVFSRGCQDQCIRINTVDYTIRDVYLNQPAYWNFLLNNPESRLIDNVCVTVYPLPDSPDKFEIVYSLVYCNGSNVIHTFLTEEVGPGSNRESNPASTITFQLFANNYTLYDCDTILAYGCLNYGAAIPSYIVGFSPKFCPLSPSCMCAMQEIISDAGLPFDGLYRLPMNLPTQCVTKRSCSVPPNPYCD